MSYVAQISSSVWSISIFAFWFAMLIAPAHPCRHHRVLHFSRILLSVTYIFVRPFFAALHKSHINHWHTHARIQIHAERRKHLNTYNQRNRHKHSDTKQKVSLTII